MQHPLRRAAGFTLIEVLVVVAIIATLTGFALLSLTTDRAGSGQRNCEQALTQWLTQVQHAAIAHRQSYFVAASETGLLAVDLQAQPAPLSPFARSHCQLAVDMPEADDWPGFMAATADGRWVGLHDDLMLVMAHGDRWPLADLLTQPIWRY